MPGWPHPTIGGGQCGWRPRALMSPRAGTRTSSPDGGPTWRRWPGHGDHGQRRKYLCFMLPASGPGSCWRPRLRRQPWRTSQHRWWVLRPGREPLLAPRSTSCPLPRGHGGLLLPWRQDGLQPGRGLHHHHQRGQLLLHATADSDDLDWSSGGGLGHHACRGGPAPTPATAARESSGVTTHLTAAGGGAEHIRALL